MTTKYLDKVEFEFLNKKLNLVFSEGDKDWDIQLFFNEEDGKYYTRGPYGRWDSVCYVELGIKTDEEVKEWIKNIKND
jgi:hypothetical protein